jgi:flagellar hook-associated protein 3
MRITNNMATQLAVQAFGVARQKMDDAQRKVTTGKSFTQASEDPTGATSVMANAGALRALDQYKRNIGVANRRLSMEETAVSQLNDLLTRAKELAMSQGTDTSSVQTRQTALVEVNQLLQQAVGLGNTQDATAFIFGGTKSDTPPFTLDTTGPVYTFTASGGTGSIQVEIAAGQRASTSHDGTQVFGTPAAGALKALQDLAAAIRPAQQPPCPERSVDSMPPSTRYRRRSVKSAHVRTRCRSPNPTSRHSARTSSHSTPTCKMSILNLRSLNSLDGRPHTRPPWPQRRG